MLENLSNGIDCELKTLGNNVRQLWYSILELDILPDDDSSNFFTLGGSSLTFTQLFNRYQFDLSPQNKLNITDFLSEPTIIQHIRLLSLNINYQTTITSVKIHNATQGNSKLVSRSSYFPLYI